MEMAEHKPQRISRLIKKKSFGQAFTKACRVRGRAPHLFLRGYLFFAFYFFKPYVVLFYPPRIFLSSSTRSSRGGSYPSCGSQNFLVPWSGTEILTAAPSSPRFIVRRTRFGDDARSGKVCKALLNPSKKRGPRKAR